MFCIQQKKGSTILYYSPIAYPAITGQEFKDKGALCNTMCSLYLGNENCRRARNECCIRPSCRYSHKFIIEISEFVDLDKARVD